MTPRVDVLPNTPGRPLAAAVARTPLLPAILSDHQQDTGLLNNNRPMRGAGASAVFGSRDHIYAQGLM